jgi:hypothetical protein
LVVSKPCDALGGEVGLGRGEAGLDWGRIEADDKTETLKYYYLLFSTPDTVSLDDYVLNTEAHPFRRPDYGKRGA